MVEAPVSPVDQSHPWPGLEAFRENDASHFFGREAEIEDLLHRVERHALTVLFSQSGLGKTSLLRAGLFPRLRREQLLPIYIRLDHSGDGADLIAQVWEALDVHLKLDGSYADPEARKGSLWEWFHDIRAGLLSERLSGVIPVLVFDQFEEIFTLGGSNGRAQHRGEFLGQLADLIERRPPESVEKRLESGEADDLAFDFDSSNYRILLSLRDDYLSQLEQERERIPSLMQNRMSIDRLSGEQALAVVTKPGAGLVNDRVAEQIVRFVGGEPTLPLGEFDVEPPLLSLVCRELNRERIKRGHDTISTSLLQGSHAGILERYYEDCFVGLDAGVRRFVEDELVTDSGHRESMTLERARRLNGEGAVKQLIESRLLHSEQRGNVPRVELTHDVLTGVVVRSRDKRREVEAREEAEREKQRAREREEKARKARRRSATISMVMGILTTASLGLLVWAVREKRVAVNARQASEKARLEAKEAQRIAGYMLEVFRGDYSRFGKLDRYEEAVHESRIYIPQDQGEEKTETLWRSGNFQLIAGNPDKAEEHFARALELAKSGDATKQADAKERLAGALVQSGKIPEAAELLKEALETRRELAQSQSEEPWKTDAENNLANTLGNLGQLHLKEGNPGSGTSSHREEIGLRSGIVSRNPANVGFIADLGLAHLRLGESLAAGNDDAGALKNYEEAGKFFFSAAEKAPRDREIQSYCASALEAEGGAMEPGNAAVEKFRQAVAIRESVYSSETYNTHYSHKLATSYHALAKALGDFGEQAEAKSYFEAAQKMFKALLDTRSGNSLVIKDAKACRADFDAFVSGSATPK